jgi:hypothetical protein
VQFAIQAARTDETLAGDTRRPAGAEATFRPNQVVGGVAFRRRGEMPTLFRDRHQIAARSGVPVNVDSPLKE